MKDLLVWIKTLAQVPDVNHSHTNMKKIMKLDV